VIFSTGWEWGYWLHDVATLRASYELPSEPTALVEHAFGRDLAGATAPVMALSDLQREYLHHGNLMAYVASRDISIDLGRQLNIVSQPDRVTFADLVAGVGVEDARTKIAGLHEYADKLDAIAKQYRPRASVGSRRW
jgi:NADH dehydrogenase FAD-containing subunit